MSNDVSNDERKGIEIRNRGPIEDLFIPTDTGGVMVLKGHNGAGKSAALAVVDELLTGDPATGYGRRDGTRVGRVSGLGREVTLKVQRRTSGELVVASMAGLDPSLFVTPPGKTREVRDAARLKQLLVLGQVEASVEDFDGVAGLSATPSNGAPGELSLLDVAGLPATGGGPVDPLGLAQALKKGLHAQARKHERQADEARGTVSALEAATKALDLEDAETDEDVLSARYEEAVEALSGARGRRQAGLEAQEAAETARARLATMEAPDVEAARGALTKAQDLVAEAERALAEARQGQSDAEAHLSTARQLAVTRAEAQKAVDAFADMEIPSEEVINDLAAAKDRAANDVSRGAQARDLQAKKADLADAEAQVTRLELTAGRLREGAGEVDERLSRMLGRGALAPYGFQVVEDCLVVNWEARGPETPVDELSAGEGYSIALDLAIQAAAPTHDDVVPGEIEGGYSPDEQLPILVLRQEAWEGLDPQNRGKVVSLAKELDVVLVTAEADDGPLRVERAVF